MRLPRPTALGFKAIVFYVILWVAFFAAPYQNLAFGMLLFGGALGIVAFVSNALRLRALRFATLHAPSAPAGDERTLRLELTGPGNRLGLEVELAGTRKLRLPVHTEDGSRHVLRLSPQVRGIEQFDEVRLCSSLPFGLFRAHERSTTPVEIVTPPRPWDEIEDGQGRSLDEVLGTPATQNGLGEVTSVRDFREGDDPKHLDWRATARRGDLVVKDRELLSRPGSEVVLDRRCDEDLFEDCLSVVAALALRQRRRGQSFTLGTQGSLASYGDEGRPWRELDRRLAELEVLQEDDAAPPAASPETLRLPEQLEHTASPLPPQPAEAPAHA